MIAPQEDDVPSRCSSRFKCLHPPIPVSPQAPEPIHDTKQQRATEQINHFAAGDSPNAYTASKIGIQMYVRDG
ncbi:hypothetical protein FKM82_001004 [Ascaphus truei]